MAPETLLVHGGEPRPGPGEPVVFPLFQSATFALGGETLRYARLSNTPTHDVLHAKLAALEGGEAALSAASGLAALSSALLGLLRPGERMLALEGLYGGTHALLAREVERLGIGVDLVPVDDPAAWERAVGERTRLFLLESTTNPLCRVPDLEAARELGRRRGLVTLVDNTFPTPLGLRCAAFGFDLVVHSATKYLNGHSDLVAGALVGRAALVERARATLALLGGSLDPHAAFLLLRGTKTLAVRLARQSGTALGLARALERHPAVRRVHHPGLPSHPDHERAARLLRGFGAMLSLELAGGEPAARRFVEALRLFVHAPSLGGVESLVVRPAESSHRGMTPEEQARLGVDGGLVRLSIGLEDEEDLRRDLEQALSSS
jgi:cystathionine gamma-synthase/cystathionine gamma-lyase/cystathionine beta-lyase